MKSADRLTLVDDHGIPLDERIQEVLRALRPRFYRLLSRLDDDVLVIEVFEEAGRRIVAYEAEHGEVDDLHAFATTTLANVAKSRLARSPMRLVSATLNRDASDAVLQTLQAREGTREQIEADIYREEILDRLPPEDRDLYFWKAWGATSRELADEYGTSEGNVNTMVYRMRLKIRHIKQQAEMKGSRPGTRQTTKRETV